MKNVRCVIPKEKIQYDYYTTANDFWYNPDTKMNYIQLSHSGKKPEVTLMIDAYTTFLLMGDQGMLKGKAFEDYINQKERKD